MHHDAVADARFLLRHAGPDGGNHPARFMAADDWPGGFDAFEPEPRAVPGGAVDMQIAATDA